MFNAYVDPNRRRPLSLARLLPNPSVVFLAIIPAIWVTLYLGEVFRMVYEEQLLSRRRSEQWSFGSLFGGGGGGAGVGAEWWAMFTSSSALNAFLSPVAALPRWGLKLSEWRTFPVQIVTHAFIHVNPRHLVGSLLGYVVGAFSVLVPMSRVFQFGHPPPPQPQQQQQPQRRGNVNARIGVAPWIDFTVATCGAIVGGIVGSLAGTIAFQRRERTKFISENSWGISFLDRFVERGYTALVDDRFIVCGGSGIVNALIGFGCGMHALPWNLVAAIAVDIGTLGVRIAAAKGPVTWADLFGFGRKYQSYDTGSGAHIVNSGNSLAEYQVGYAAHIGAAVVGFGLGLAYRRAREWLDARSVDRYNRLSREARVREMGPDPFVEPPPQRDYVDIVGAPQPEADPRLDDQERRFAVSGPSGGAGGVRGIATGGSRLRSTSGRAGVAQPRGANHLAARGLSQQQASDLAP